SLCVLFMAGDKLYLLIIGILGIGFSFGGIFSSIPIFIDKMWGTKKYGMNTSIFFIDLSLGITILGNIIPNIMYDNFAKRQGRNFCKGRRCFGYFYLLCSFLGCISIILLAIVIRRLHYREIREARERERETL